MMRGIAGRLIGLLVVLLVGVSYITFNSLGIRLGKQSYPLTVELPRSGGIYQNATVTYRGVVVGKVSGVDLEPTAVRLTLAIHPGIQIPNSSTVSVRNLSAAGEQYVDFVPHSDGAPYLRAGATIPAARTHLPATIGNVLSDTSMLVRAIDPKDVSRIAHELSTGFAGTGPQLHRLVTSSLALLRQLRAVEPDTLTLIRTGHQLLGTATATSGQLRRFADGLQRLSAQLQASDPNIRTILADAPSVLSQLAHVLGTNRSQIRSLFDDLAPITAIGAARVPAFDFLLHVLPTFGQTLQSIVGHHRLKTFVYINNNTPVCSYRHGRFTLPTHPTKYLPARPTCHAHDPQMLERGAANAPRPRH